MEEYPKRTTRKKIRTMQKMKVQIDAMKQDFFSKVFLECQAHFPIQDLQILLKYVIGRKNLKRKGHKTEQSDLTTKSPLIDEYELERINPLLFMEEEENNLAPYRGNVRPKNPEKGRHLLTTPKEFPGSHKKLEAEIFSLNRKLKKKKGWLNTIMNPLREQLYQPKTFYLNHFKSRPDPLSQRPQKISTSCKKQKKKREQLSPLQSQLKKKKVSWICM